MLRRILALVFGAAVIAGGLAIRERREAVEVGGIPKPEASPPRPSPYDVFDNDKASVLCAEELASVCKELGLLFGTSRTESAWTTAERLAGGGQLGADAWVTFRPWDEMARLPGAGVSFALAERVPMARTTVALAGPPPAIAALGQQCGDATTALSCAAESDQALALRDPAVSAAGALALAAVAAEIGVAPDAQLVRDPVTRERLAAIVRRARVTAVPVEDVLRLGGTAAALALESDASAAVVAVAKNFDQIRAYDKLALRYPLDARAVEVVGMPANDFRRVDDVTYVLRSYAAGAILTRGGFEAPEPESHALTYAPPFATRPTIRADLPPPSPRLLADLRALAAGRGPG